MLKTTIIIASLGIVVGSASAETEKEKEARAPCTIQGQLSEPSRKLLAEWAPQTRAVAREHGCA